MFSCEYLREFSKKFETVLMGYSGAGGKLIDEKNQKQKISWHCPFYRWQMRKIFNQKNFNTFVGTPLDSRHIYIFAFKFTLRYLQPDINPNVCHRCHWYRWQFATGVFDTGSIFAAGIVDTGSKFATGINNTSETGGKFAAGIVDTGVQPWAANISENFRKIRNGLNGILRGSGETDSWKN